MTDLKTILLVEDNLLDVELITEALTQSKLANRIFSVRDGADALDYLRYEGRYANREKANPCVILLDIKMPRVDGIEVLEAIKKDNHLRKIPIVMLTSSREEPDLKKCYELGVNAYVVKPVDFKDFIGAVKQIGSFWAILNELPGEE
ncbi:MAG TPA: response regulator [Catalimonadaceae bacterium]|nr:response regulator [Catalimonadaceae bacterium]HPI12344.1 response regulator [Catalimonadaceae bacterium]